VCVCQDWKNIWAPVQLICEKVSRAQIQQAYSLVFPTYKDLGADELLNAYARMRSFYKDHGRPDEAHAARIILKDFCSGKLLYAHPPPDLTLAQRGEFYGSFRVGGENLINEALYLSPAEIAARKEAQLAASVEGLAGSEGAAPVAEAPGDDAAASSGGGIVNTRRLAGASSSAMAPTQRKASKALAAAAAKRAAQSKAIREAKDESGDEDEEAEDEDDEDEESEDDEGASASAAAGGDEESLPGRRARSTVNQAALDAQMADDLAALVTPSNAGSVQSRDAAKLLAAGFNPDGTPLSKKQLQRMGQRNKKKTGKAFKLRKNAVPMEEVGYKIGGKSSDSAARLGVFHG
jgi:hypothetical protein